MRSAMSVAVCCCRAAFCLPLGAAAVGRGLRLGRRRRAKPRSLTTASPALRYMHAPLDESSPEARERTIKPFHHVFSPDGETLLTKGPGGLYPHHRGLFFGFNKITLRRRQEVRRVALPQWRIAAARAGAGPRGRRRLGAGQRVAIDWHGRDGEVFANEEREFAVTPADARRRRGLADRLLVARRRPPTASRFTSTAIRSTRASISAQRRKIARQGAAQNKDKQIYFCAPTARARPARRATGITNKPDAPSERGVRQSAVERDVRSSLGGERYTVLYLDHPSNPKPARYSERDYGRFGSYFVADVTKDMPLNVKYRVWVQPGEMTVEQCEKMSADFNAESTVLPADVGCSAAISVAIDQAVDVRSPFREFQIVAPHDALPAAQSADSHAAGPRARATSTRACWPRWRGRRSGISTRTTCSSWTSCRAACASCSARRTA